MISTNETIIILLSFEGSSFVFHFILNAYVLKTLVNIMSTNLYIIYVYYMYLNIHGLKSQLIVTQLDCVHTHMHPIGLLTTDFILYTVG